MSNKEKRNLLKRRKSPEFARYSMNSIHKAMSIAIEMKKISKGHLYSKQLKDRCVFCGQTMKTKKECEYWFMTFLDRLQTVLVNPGFFTNQDIQALWLQHGDEYQNIQLPLVVGLKDGKQN